MDNQERINRHRRRNLPAELKVEIVDCFPVENAVHFLANVPNRLIIRHCAPRVRRMLKMIDQIANDYACKLSNSICQIRLMNGHQYTSEMDILLCYGGDHCNGFFIWPGTSDGFVGYPTNFFNDLIKHYYDTNVPTMAVRRVAIQLPWANPAPWPTALIQPQAGEMNVEVDIAGQSVYYILRNKYNPNIRFNLRIDFDGGAKCYQEMTRFELDFWRFDCFEEVHMMDAQPDEAREDDDGLDRILAPKARRMRKGRGTSGSRLKRAGKGAKKVLEEQGH